MNWIKKLPEMSSAEINNRILILKMQMSKLSDIQQEKAQFEIAVLEDELFKRDDKSPLEEYIKQLTRRDY